MRRYNTVTAVCLKLHRIQKVPLEMGLSIKVCYVITKMAAWLSGVSRTKSADTAKQERKDLHLVTPGDVITEDMGYMRYDGGRRLESIMVDASLVPRPHVYFNIVLSHDTLCPIT